MKIIPKISVKTNIPELPPTAEPKRKKLTTSGKIEIMQAELKKRKKEKEDLDLKYRLIIQTVTQRIKKDSLDHKLVLKLIAIAFEEAEKTQ